MKKFLLRLSFFLILFMCIIMLGILLPPTPRSETSLLFAKLDKDSLLENVHGPKIILIGGSNLSFGINSQLIKDSVEYFPINTSIHASIGLVYMMDNCIDYVKAGDVIILSPDYSQFYDGYAYGREELLRTVVEVSPASYKTLGYKQWLNIIKYVPKYVISKFKYSEYKVENKQLGVYERKSFNKYGDACAHWGMPQHKYVSGKVGVNYNSEIIDKIIEFGQMIEEKGAQYFVTFPCMEKNAFLKNEKEIIAVYNDVAKKKIPTLGTPQRYIIDSVMTFNAVSHLTKEGADIRTNLLIEDLKKNIRK